MVMARSRLFRHTSLLLVLSLLVLTAGRANAQTYPSNKITLIVAFAAGGVADTLARMVGQGLSERLHQNVVATFEGNTARPKLDADQSYLLVVDQGDGNESKITLKASAATRSGPLILTVR